MTVSKGALGNLINRYRAVLGRCRLMNVFGSLAIAGMLVVGSVQCAAAEPVSIIWGEHQSNETIKLALDGGSTITGNLTAASGGSISLTGTGPVRINGRIYVVDGQSSFSGDTIVIDNQTVNATGSAVMNYGGTLHLGDGSSFSNNVMTLTGSSAGTVATYGNTTIGNNVSFIK